MKALTAALLLVVFGAAHAVAAGNSEHGRTQGYFALRSRATKPAKQGSPLPLALQKGSLPFHDSFPGGAAAEAKWDVTGDWAVGADGFRTGGAGRNTAVAYAAPELAQQTIIVRMSVGKRASEGSWAFAGIMLAQDPGSYWHLALVESPSGERYGELVEQLNGVWQAQDSLPTQLAGGPETRARWEPGEYVFVLRLSPQGIEGEIAAPDGLVFKGGYRFAPGVPAVRSGQVGLQAVEMAASAREVRVMSDQSARASGPAAKPRAAVLQADLPGMPAELPAKIASALRRDGLLTDLLSPEQAADPARLSRARYGVVVVPQCQTFPGVARENVLQFLRDGGNLIALGGPIFEQVLWKQDGKWVGESEMLAALQPTQTLIDWSRQDLSQWARGSNHPEVKATHEVVPGEEGGPAHALRMEVPHLEGWDTFASPPLRDLFAQGKSVTILEAKASVETTGLVEWVERDGSRWIATIRLTPQWKRFALPPEAFGYWRDNPSKGRGAKGDWLDVANVDHLSIGIAIGHGNARVGGPYTLWFGEIGAAPSPLSAIASQPPLLEAMSPPYKVYRTRAEADMAPPKPVEVVCPIRRSRGLGQTGTRPGRWIPLLDAGDEGWEDLRGHFGSTYVSLSGPFRNATWTSIGIRDSAYLLSHLDDLYGRVIATAAWRAVTGLWLAKAGTDRFCYFSGEPVSIAAYVANFTDRAQGLACDFSLYDGKRDPIRSGAAPVTPEAHASARVAAPWKAAPLPPGEYMVRVSLRQTNDEIEQWFRVIEPPDAAPDEIVSAHDGDFWLGGRKWNPHGINYWPSYATGLEPFEYWLHWLSPEQYDPEVVELDLGRLQALGANLVSIQYNTPEQAPALNDFLVRALAHGILVNVFIPGANPLNVDEAQFTTLVKSARLAGNPAVFAYDIAWEPALGSEEARRRFEPQWTAWVKDRYGSVEDAERDWGFHATRRADGSLAGPTQEQILNDGDHRRMVAAFRRFVDDTISAGYNRVTQVLRELDPTHLVGARTGYGGNGQEGVDPAMPFDLCAGAKHLDFVSPEGYGLSGAWENFEAGGFTTLYGRWAGNGKPIYWAEFGMPIYPDTTPEKYVQQGDLYGNMYRMMLESGANGSAGWWFPGGLRIDENSDFGIMNPDGTPRPSALALKEFAPQIEAGRDRKPPEAWFTIDRDLHPRGYSQVWARARKDYLEAARAGKSVGVRTEGTGTTSADCPAVAVGDVPWNGSNPPKYLNAEFNSVRVEGGRAIVSVGNTGEATWLSPASAGGNPGAVYVVAMAGEKEVARAPITADVPRFGDATVTLALPQGGAVELVVMAEGRTRFGPKWSLEPPGRP